MVDTYLMRQKFTYTWTIEISDPKMASLGFLRVTSAEPQIARYAPQAGEIAVKEVRIQYGRAELPKVVPDQVVAVRKSKDFQIWQIAEGADVPALVVAGILGLISGLAIYSQAPLFGSLKDYLALFTWGAGVDQGKNFLQALGNQAGTHP